MAMSLADALKNPGLDGVDIGPVTITKVFDIESKDYEHGTRYWHEVGLSAGAGPQAVKAYCRFWGVGAPDENGVAQGVEEVHGIRQGSVITIKSSPSKKSPNKKVGVSVVEFGGKVKISCSEHVQVEVKGASKPAVAPSDDLGDEGEPEAPPAPKPAPKVAAKPKPAPKAAEPEPVDEEVTPPETGDELTEDQQAYLAIYPEDHKLLGYPGEGLWTPPFRTMAALCKGLAVELGWDLGDLMSVASEDREAAFKQNDLIARMAMTLYIGRRN